MTTPVSLTWAIFLLLCQIMACLLNRLSTEYQVKGLVPPNIVDHQAWYFLTVRPIFLSIITMVASMWKAFCVTNFPFGFLGH